MDTLLLTELNPVNFQLPLLIESRKLPETSDGLRRVSSLSSKCPFAIINKHLNFFVWFVVLLDSLGEADSTNFDS